ncbi:MarR family transcriptional regulator [Sphingobacteriaceae bacterium]|nr:MarR family transcriptional regulator [Sphingobacteriaceae bacterium]
MTVKERIQHFRSISRNYSDNSILMHEAIARKAGLSGTDHKYLGLILQKGQMTAGELSKVTGLTTGAVTGLIDRLEKKKLVQREFVKDDRRKVIIVANKQNTNKVMEPLFKDVQEKTSKLISSFSEKEFQIIEKYFVNATKIMKETQEKLSKK